MALSTAESVENWKGMGIIMNHSSLLLLEYLSSVIENRSLITDRHDEHIRLFTALMLEKIRQFYPDYGLTAENCREIVMASAMHDIGKVAIPDKILMKTSRLTDDEYRLVKNHTKKGKQIFDHILSKMNPEDEDYQLFQYCAEICMCHHERYDGNGYPGGLKGDDIPISAQVVGLADAYDSLLSDRLYKSAHTREDAFNMIVEGDCGVFSTRMLEIFRMVRLELEELLEKEKSK